MILLAYASKSGTAKETAEKISLLLPEVVLSDLSENVPVIESYDAIIIGSGIRMGSFHKDVKRFIETNKDALLEKKLAIFFTHGFAASATEILEQNVPEDLRNHAVWSGSVGGTLDVDKLKGFDKTIAKMVTRAVKDGQEVNEGINEARLKELVGCF